MSLKRNITANYVSQIYGTLIGILMVPMYIKYMGAEAYGLVGFFVMLQSWFQLLDMGLTPTMARETARFKGGVMDAQTLRRLLRAMEGIFVGVAIVGSFLFAISAGSVANSWLKVEHLPISEVQHAIVLMGAIVALRWVSGLYRGAVSGFEHLVWLSGFNMAVATARFVLIIPFFAYVGTSPTHFFGYQLFLAVIEVFSLVAQTYRLLPKTTGRTEPWQLEPLRGVLKFSLTIAFTGSVWVLVTQIDKLVLSKILSLTEYAYFTLAVLVAGGVGVISGPISAALLPRMSKLAAAHDDASLVQLYRSATQLVGVIAIPTSFALALFSKQVLWAWTGDVGIADSAGAVLKLYAIGNGMLAISAFPYYLQFAKGELRLHLIGSGLFLILLIPTLVWATLQYGSKGAGWAWLSANFIYLLAWVPVVHSHFFKGLHKLWLLKDIGPILLTTSIGAIFLMYFNIPLETRISVALSIIFFGFLLLAFAASGSILVRKIISDYWHLKFGN